MRRFHSDKIPKPSFEYDAFHKWLNGLSELNSLQDDTQIQKKRSRFAVEIGCGVGLHPIRWALENPHDKILAIERTHEKFGKFSRRLNNHSTLQNVWPAHADAAHLLPHLLKPQSVDLIFILYPNPYPKTKHQNLRLAYSPFTMYLQQLLKSDGILQVATNSHDYATELESVLPNHSHFRLHSKSEIDNTVPSRTHFEKKYLARGDRCIDLIFSPAR